MDFELNDFRKALPKIKDVQTFIMDPPYNIKFDYQSKYKDNLTNNKRSIRYCI